MFKKMFHWINGLFKDEKGSPSSKRFIGILCGITLCITLFANQFTDEHIAPSAVLVNAVAALANSEGCSPKLPKLYQDVAPFMFLPNTKSPAKEIKLIK